MHMKHMDFYHKEQKIEMNKEHYYPSFLAKDVDELRANPNTRKALKKFKIFEAAPNFDDD